MTHNKKIIHFLILILEKRKFEEELDVDGNGVLEGQELSFWIGPDNTEIAIEEAGMYYRTFV